MVVEPTPPSHEFLDVKVAKGFTKNIYDLKLSMSVCRILITVGRYQGLVLPFISEVDFSKDIIKTFDISKISCKWKDQRKYIPSKI